eukprot:g30683.t1
MHLINSSAQGFNKLDEDICRPNVKVSKGTPIVTVSTAIAKDQEILLHYTPNPDRDIATLPSDAHPSLNKNIRFP